MAANFLTTSNWLAFVLAVSPAFLIDGSGGHPVPVSQASRSASQLPWMSESMAKLEGELVAKHGEGQRARLRRGMQQVVAFWRATDGDAAAFEDFVRRNFAGDQARLDAIFNRFERNLEQLDGHLHEIAREFSSQSDLDLGPILPFDEAFAGYDPAAHIVDDFFQNKLAFTVLLNFPLTTLEERLTEGEKWSRRQWAEARLAQRFSKRVPAEVKLAMAQAAADSARYIAQYNIWMHHLVDASGARLFPPQLRLISHWNLRDEIKADYRDAQQGLAKQRMIQQVMERIVTQTIPAAVIDNPSVDWNPYTNEVKPASVKDDEGAPSSERAAGKGALDAPEPNTRYARLLAMFHASRKLDPHSPTAPTLIARRFDEDREIPEARARAMLEQIVSSPLVARAARLIETRLGRPLEPFDIYYDGFRPRGDYTEAQLDAVVANRYPNAEAYSHDIPNLLVHLGFSRERAEYLAGNIVVEPARGSGHAMGARMRSATAHLRTRIEKGGMNYKGFNIAVHEMGHNVEETFSLNNVDHTLLQGVPNMAFTEAFAMVFQGRDLELLGLARPDPKARALNALAEFWVTYEISGAALVDVDVWHWMYDHPSATPAELRDATTQIARQIWNKFYAPVFKKRDVVLLGIYSHMIVEFLYLPDYPLGHMIAFQIGEQMEKAGEVGSEFERMATLGRIVPDLWMRSATGKPVGPEALLAATDTALTEIGGGDAVSGN